MQPVFCKIVYLVWLQWLMHLVTYWLFLLLLFVCTHAMHDRLTVKSTEAVTSLFLVLHVQFTWFVTNNCSHIAVQQLLFQILPLYVLFPGQIQNACSDFRKVKPYKNTVLQYHHCRFYSCFFLTWCKGQQMREKLSATLPRG